jgi:heat shock protein HtpX
MIHQEIKRQKRNRYIQMGFIGLLMIIVFIGIGSQIVRIGGWFFVFGLTLIVLAIFYYATRPIVLSQVNALSYQEVPELYNILHTLVERAHLEHTPHLYYINNPVPNAATVGSKERAFIILTRGILARLNHKELTGVLAHEISHIKNNDLVLFRITEVIKQATYFTSRFGWLLLLIYSPVIILHGFHISFWIIVILIVAPILSVLLQFALIRSSEFNADLGSAELTDDPEALAAALQKIYVPQPKSAFSMFSPVHGKEEFSLFKTHPSTEVRIQRLMKLKQMNDKEKES